MLVSYISASDKVKLDCQVEGMLKGVDTENFKKLCDATNTESRPLQWDNFIPCQITDVKYCPSLLIIGVEGGICHLGAGIAVIFYFFFLSHFCSAATEIKIGVHSDTDSSNKVCTTSEQ